MDTSVVLHPLQHLELAVIHFYSMAKGYSQTGVVLIYQTWYPSVLAFITVATVARGYHYIMVISKFNSPHYRNTVHDSSVEHGYTIHIHYCRHIRKTTARSYYIYSPLPVARTFTQILCPTSKAVGCHHLELSRIIEECVII